MKLFLDHRLTFVDRHTHRQTDRQTDRVNQLLNPALRFTRWVTTSFQTCPPPPLKATYWKNIHNHITTIHCFPTTAQQ